jgi:chromosome segregation ATPase
MASSRQRIRELEAELRAATEERSRLEVRLQSEQGRTARLEASLVERDRRILRLSSPPGGPPA